MGVRELHHAARLQEWEARIRDCRSSGQSIRGWCQEHGISEKTYYRWERSCIVQATKSLTQPAGNGALVRIEPGQLPLGNPKQLTVPEIRLQHGATSIELPAGTAPEAVAALVAALNQYA